MKNILIWRAPIPGSELDFLHKTDYRRLYERTVELFGSASGYNFGNKVWYQGICSAIERPGNHITYGTTESAEEINDHYDLIVYPMANFFGEQFCSDTTELVKRFSQIHIPVYIIACGAQAESYDHLDSLVSKIGDPAKRFIDAIYRTGGEFALRGYFTKEFFDLLGYKSAVVTGCPSLYQVGPNLKIKKRSTQPSRPVINGKIKSFEAILRDMPGSIFMDQDQFLECLYSENYFYPSRTEKEFSFYRSRSIFQAELLGAGRIHLIPDVDEWYSFLQAAGFDYSFGTKIHGSIMPILAGVPATVLGIDSRTQEMAEFFDIPYCKFDHHRKYTRDDLYAAYEQADYSAFNTHFPERYFAFEQFLREKGIVDEINRENRFLCPTDAFTHQDYQPNRVRFQRFARKLRAEEPLLRLAVWALQKKNKHI